MGNRVLLHFRFLLCLLLLAAGSVWAQTESEPEAESGKTETNQPAETAEPPESPVEDSLWLTLLKNFAGGVQLEGTVGGAEVESSIEKNGKSQVVASGDADQSGFKVAFNRPPEGTEFFWRLSPNYFQQKITIQDFRKNIDQPVDSGSTQIETVVTNYDENGVVDANSPNAFDINLKSGGIDLLLGGSLDYAQILGGGRPFARFDFIAGISLLEYRDVFVDFGSASIQDTKWTFLESWRLGFAYNIAPQEIPVSFRTSIFYQSYLDVKYPRKLEFRSATVTYNKDINAYQRDRVFVSGFQLTHITVRFSLFYAF